jgi:outer membrane lipoprotein SlyB
MSLNFNLDDAVSELTRIQSELDSIGKTGEEKLEITSQMQENIQNIISDLALQKKEIKNLKDTKKTISSKTAKNLNERIKGIEKVKTYAIQLQQKLESLQFQSVREMHSSDFNQSSPLPIENLLTEGNKKLSHERNRLTAAIVAYGSEELPSNLGDLITQLQRITDSNPSDEKAQKLLEIAKNVRAFGNLQALMLKFSRSESVRNFTTNDVNDIKILADFLNKPSKQILSPEMQQLKNLVTEMALEMCGVFEKGMEQLLNVSQDKLKMHMLKEISRNKEPKSDVERLQRFEQCSEIYWSYSDPFEAHFGLDGFCNIVLDSLSGKETPFRSLFEKMPKKEKNNLMKTITLLKQSSSQIQDTVTGKIYKDLRNDPSLRQAVIEIKTRFLGHKRAQNKNLNSEPVSVNIIGGGPGGMIRSLIAGIKGHTATVIEMRESYTRHNMVKLVETDIIKYFGIRERLEQRGHIDSKTSAIEVKLKDLEDTLDDIAQEIYGGEEYRMTGQVLDILPGSDSKAGCLIKKGAKNGPKEDVFLTADLHVDSTGARADMAKMLGIGTQKIADSQMMVALVMKGETGGKGKTEGETEFSSAIPLSSPDQHYSLIQPSVKNQEILGDLIATKTEVWRKMTRLQENIEKMSTSAIDLRPNIEAALDEKTLRSIKKHKGDKYNIKLLESANRQLMSLKKEHMKIEKKIDSVLLRIASEQQERKIEKDDIEQIAPFNIELHQRIEPSIVHGTSIMMFSGDSLATPDPKSGAGAGHALAGGTVFAKVLEDKRNRLTPEEIKVRFNYGSQQQMSQVTGQGVSSRMQLQEDPKLTETYFLHEGVKLQFLTAEEAKTLEILSSKKIYGGFLTPEEQLILHDLKDRFSKITANTTMQQNAMNGLQGIVNSLIG